MEGDDVWILNLEDNPVQLYWFRRDRREDNAELEGEQNVEVLCNRATGTGWATIYFSNGTGWMIRNGEAYARIAPSGEIMLDTHMSNRYIRLCRSGIELGGTEHDGARGDVIQDALETITSCLEAIRAAASTNPYTLAISSAIGSTPEKVAAKVPLVTSPHVKLG